jgi:SAM-dependent methyltransferase
MYTEAELYDLLYASGIDGKDYSAEAGEIAALVRRARPHSRTLLDIACGTGEHARYLSEVHGFEVDGIDISPDMIARARAKCPRGRFDIADMASFQLGRCYDGLLCMFSAIGHVVTLPRLRDTLACMRAHLAPGGVAVVQPYLTPDAIPKLGTREYCFESGDLKVRRTRFAELDGRCHRVSYHYNIEGPDGMREADEVEEWGLFTRDEMLATFSAVGLAATYDPSGWSDATGRGIYIALAPA